MTQAKHTPGPKIQKATIGDTIKVKVYKVGNFTIRKNLYSAPWRRIWWAEPQAFSDLPAVKVMREEKGIEASSMFEAVPYASLKSAASAIYKATGSAA